MRELPPRNVVGVKEAQLALSEIIQQVLEGDRVTVTRYGKPVVMIVRPEDVKDAPSAESPER